MCGIVLKMTVRFFRFIPNHNAFRSTAMAALQHIQLPHSSVMARGPDAWDTSFTAMASTRKQLGLLPLKPLTASKRSRRKGLAS